MVGNYLQQTTSADDIFRCIFSWRLRVNICVVMFMCFCHFPMWRPRSGVVLACIDCCSLPYYSILFYPTLTSLVGIALNIFVQK